MAFIVKKKINGKDYYYLRKSVREGNKVRAVNIAYLGKTKKDAEEKFKKMEKKKNSMENKNVKKADYESTDISIEDMTNFCKRKGFVYPSGDIYGGLAGFWDFGHLGVEMKKNLKNDWWKFHVQEREDIVGIDGSIITNPEVWKASGHVDSFSDIFVVCKKCKKPNKIDKNELGKVKCDDCGGEYDEETAKEFKLMFKTNVGEDGFAYLRPETAQLIFTNFKYVQENARMKLPFGIAQIGKAFRNEIAPRDFMFRSREFEQMEIEYFVDPKEKCPYEIGDSEILVYSDENQEKEEEPKKMKFKDALKKGVIKTDWHAYWLEQELLWFVNLGANSDKFRIRQHTKDEKSHYALDTWDLEYKFPFGWKELQGMANRSDFDLSQHQKFSKTSMEILDKDEKKILPHVVCEPSQGVERGFLVFLFDAYEYDKERDNVVLHLHPKLAPVKVGIFPIVKKEEMLKVAEDVRDDLKKEFNVFYDTGGSVGRRYARQDEAGTPYCVTIDGDSIKGKDVTIRDRDTEKQIRVKIEDLKDVITQGLRGEDIMKMGKMVDTRKK